MKFITIPCHKDLQPFIRNYWLLTSHCTTRGTQQIFSNGADSLHFYLTQSVRLEDEEREYRTSLNHHELRSMEIHSEPGKFNILGVEFVPFCTRLFFPQTIGAHTTPQDMQDPDFQELEKVITGTEDMEQQRMTLDKFFCKRLEQLSIDELNMERLSSVFSDIVPTEEDPKGIKDYESLSPADLASTACLGQKQFTRVFNKYVGLAPKTYIRLLRFNKTMKELQKSGKTTTLSEIAWQCGYYDLPHMTNDFRQLCGHTPSEIVEMGSKLTEAFQPEFSNQMKKKVLLENLE